MSAAELFPDADVTVATYAVTIKVRNLLVGGVPSDPSVIRNWLRARLELDDAALEEALAATVAERDVALGADEKIDLLMASEAAPSINGFKRDQDTGELVYEGRCMKAALKEWMNSAYPGTEWPGKAKLGKSYRKGLMKWAAEWVHVPEDIIGLGVKEPARVEERIKHVSTAKGPVSAISRVEVVEAPTLSFHITVKDDLLPRHAWGRIWMFGEDIGIGADRGRSDGKFDLIEFERM